MRFGGGGINAKWLPYHVQFYVELLNEYVCLTFYGKIYSELKKVSSYTLINRQGVVFYLKVDNLKVFELFFYFRKPLK